VSRVTRPNAGLEAASPVVGMGAGAGSIDDMAPVTRPGTGWVFDRAWAPTIGPSLQAYTLGHVRQLDTVASELPTGVATHGPQALGDGTSFRSLADAANTIIEVEAVRQAGSGYGHSAANGLIVCRHQDWRRGRGSAAAQGIGRVPARETKRLVTHASGDVATRPVARILHRLGATGLRSVRLCGGSPRCCAGLSGVTFSWRARGPSGGIGRRTQPSTRRSRIRRSAASWSRRSWR
jgi:hypothetical protein